ncbi:MAG: FHA domain-containing protein [Pseudomonadota bacterium]
MEIAISRSGRGSGINGTLVSRHQLGYMPLVVGRGFGSDLHLPDPRLDAAHLALGCDPESGPWVEALASTNGAKLNEHPLPAGERVPFASGAVITLGRCELAVYAVDHPVAPAVSPNATERLKSALQTPAVWLPLTMASLALVLGLDFLSYGRDYEPEVLLNNLTGFFITPTLWMLFWSLINKLSRGEFNFLPHWCIGVVGVAALPLLEELLQLVGFNWQSLNGYRLLDALTSAALLIGGLYLSLSLATQLGSTPRALVTAVPVALLLVTSYLLPALQAGERVNAPQLLALSRPPVFQVTPAVSVDSWLADADALFGDTRAHAETLRLEAQARRDELARREAP